MQDLQCQKHVGVIQLRQIALDSIDFPPLNYLCTVFEKITQKVPLHNDGKSPK